MIIHMYISFGTRLSMANFQCELRPRVTLLFFFPVSGRRDSFGTFKKENGLEFCLKIFTLSSRSDGGLNQFHNI